MLLPRNARIGDGFVRLAFVAAQKPVALEFTTDRGAMTPHDPCDLARRLSETKESVYDSVSTNPLNPPYQGDFLGAPSMIRKGWGGFVSAKIAL